MKSVYTTKFKYPSKCTCINVRRSSRAITQLFDEVLAPSGIKITQYSLLRTILVSGALNMSELAEQVRLDRTTLARNLKFLEARGLITIDIGEDTRTRQVKITKEGKEVLEVSLPLWEKAQTIVKEYLGEEKLSMLITLLSELENIID